VCSTDGVTYRKNRTTIRRISSPPSSHFSVYAISGLALFRYVISLHPSLRALINISRDRMRKNLRKLSSDDQDQVSNMTYPDRNKESLKIFAHIQLLAGCLTWF
jgi:hypothetical protein